MMKLSPFLVALLLALAAIPGRAETRRVGPATVTTPAPPRPTDWSDGRYHFRAEETTRIQEYFRAHPPPPPAASGKTKKKRLPPGLRKKVERGGELPPGWQKKVARGEVMDPAVYRHAEPLPQELVRVLPPQPEGTVVVTVEGKVARLVGATLTILDVFDLLAR